MLQRRRKPKRLYSAIAAMLGVALAVFELRRFHLEGPEVWFWLCVAALMIVLGMIGVLQRDDPDEPMG